MRSTVADIRLITDRSPYPELPHAEIRLSDGRTLMLLGHDEIAVQGAP
jgi:hypothetical protein